MPRLLSFIYQKRSLFLAIWGVFVASLMLISLSHHAMWRDEMQAWAIARDSASFSDFFLNLGFECFPPLWHGLLKGLQVFCDDPAAMQVLHGILALLNLFLILRMSPLPVFVRILVAASLPFAYQYAVISRCYALGLSFLMLALVARQRRKPMAFWALLGLGCQTTILETGVAIVLALRQWLISPSLLKTEKRGVALFVLLAAFSVWMSIPPAERMAASDIVWRGHLLELFALFSWSWTANIFAYSSVLPYIAESLFILLLCGIVFFRDWRGQAAFFCLILGFAAIDQLAYGLAPPHLLLLPVGFFLLLWQNPPQGSALQKAAMAFLFLPLTVMGLGQLAFPPDIPYSQSQNVANWIETNGLKFEFWVSLPDYTGTPVAGYLGRQFYNPQCDCETAAPHWAKNNIPAKDLEQLFALSDAAMRKRGVSMAYFLLGDIWGQKSISLPPGLHLEPLAEFKGSAIRDEQYTVFRATRRP
jgi:hypothetical protein